MDREFDPWIGNYVDHIAHEYPAGRQMINDSGASSSGEAFFEVKTYHPGNTRYDHNHLALKPADRRARDITSEYSRKFKNLDKKYAMDVVGEGDNGIVGPFEVPKVGSLEG